MRRKYRVMVDNPQEQRYGLMFSGVDLDEAIEVYEECRHDSLSGYDPCNVILINEDGKQLARTDMAWIGKIKV